MRLTQWLEELRDDVRFAARQLKSTPGFTFVAVITLALGIGANGAIFALADATLLRPLPLPIPNASRSRGIEAMRCSGVRYRRSTCSIGTTRVAPSRSWLVSFRVLAAW